MPLAFVRGMHRWPVDSLHKGPVTWVTRKMCLFDDVIMCRIQCQLILLFSILSTLPTSKQSVTLSKWKKAIRVKHQNRSCGRILRGYQCFSGQFYFGEILRESLELMPRLLYSSCKRPSQLYSNIRNPYNNTCHQLHLGIVVRRAGLLWSQQDFEWRWSVPLFKCLTVLEFSFILFDLCLLITFFNFIMNYVPIVTFWIFTYHKIWILSIMFCFIWSYWIIYFLACLEVSWRVVS